MAPLLVLADPDTDPGYLTFGVDFFDGALIRKFYDVCLGLEGVRRLSLFSRGTLS